MSTAFEDTGRFHKDLRLILTAIQSQMLLSKNVMSQYKSQWRYWKLVLRWILLLCEIDPWTPLIVLSKTVGAYPNICTQKICENCDSICHQSCKRKMKDKTPLLHKFVCFQMHERHQAWSFIIWVSFQKTMLPQREPFLTMFYTFNSSPLLVTK